MLINNLQKHREMYSAERLSLGQTGRSLSNTKTKNAIAKTEKCGGLKTKYGSQKKIIYDPYQTTTANSAISKYEKYQPPSTMSATADNFVKICYSNKKQGNGLRKHTIFNTQECWTDMQDRERIIKGERISDLRHKAQMAYKKYPSAELQKIRSSVEIQSKLEKIKEASRQQNILINRYKNQQNEMCIKTEPLKIIKDSYNMTTSIDTVKSNYKSITIKPQKTAQIRADEEKFINKLKFHDVFFCADCFRYIFAIEKSYHYPDCQNKANQEKMNEGEKYKMGIEKLNLLLQLAQYTKSKPEQIKKISSDIVERSKLPPDLALPSARTYYSLLEVETAAHIIIQRLIFPYLSQSGQGKYFCKNIVCDRDNQL